MAEAAFTCADALKAYAGIYQTLGVPTEVDQRSTRNIANKVTGELFVEAAQLQYTGILGNEPISRSVPVLHSNTSRTAVIPFPFGYVRHSSAIQADADVYMPQLQQILSGALAATNLRALVLCGHSEGGTVCEALALRMLAEEQFAALRNKLFVVTSGTHLWMSSAQRDSLQAHLTGRHASLVAALQLDSKSAVYDVFTTLSVTKDGEHASDLHEMPQMLMLVAESDRYDCDPSGMMQLQDLVSGQGELLDRGIDAKKTTDFMAQYVHCWDTDENIMLQLVQRPELLSKLL